MESSRKIVKRAESGADTDRTARVSAAVAMLCEGLPGKTPSPTTFKAYALGLDDIPVEAIERAALRALKVCKFVPSVPELRELCGLLTKEQRAVKAWDVINDALKKHHYYRSIRFDDPALNATVHNLGGWLALSERWSDGPADEWDKWARKDFEKVYLAFVASGAWGENGTKPLVGYYDQNNSFTGRRGKQYLVEYNTGLPALTDATSAPKRIGAKTADMPSLTAGIGRKP